MPVQKYDVRRSEADGGGFEERHWTPTNSPVLKDGRLMYIVQRVEDITAFVYMTRAAEASDDRAVQLRARDDTIEGTGLPARRGCARQSSTQGKPCRLGTAL